MRKSAERTKWGRGGIGAGVTILLSAAIVAAVSPFAGAATSQGAHGATTGSVAAISGTTMEVQSASAGQTAVDWTASTTFSQIVDDTASSGRGGLRHRYRHTIQEVQDQAHSSERLDQPILIVREVHHRIQQ